MWICGNPCQADDARQWSASNHPLSDPCLLLHHKGCRETRLIPLVSLRKYFLIDMRVEKRSVCNTIQHPTM